MPLREAAALERAGDDEAAKAAYLAHLQRDPDDVGALFALGNLLFRTGYRSAARTAYSRAVQLDGANLSARVNLGNTLLELGDPAAAVREYAGALERDPAFAPAHQGLSYAYARMGDDELSLRHRDRGFTGHAVTHAPYRGTGTPLRVLVLYSAAGGNFSTEWLLDSTSFDVYRVAAEYADPQAPLPPHDVAVNAIGDADLCARALEAAAALLQSDGAPVLNAPERVAQTGREEVARRLAGIPGLRVPRIARVTRGELAAGEPALRARGFEFPLLLRTPGHHTGRHFVKAGGRDELREALAQLPSDELFVLEFADLRADDGLVRKYRVMRIGTETIPVHAAAARSWKVHLFSSQQDEDPHGAIGAAELRTLDAVFESLGLDYGGIDFGIGRDGRMVLFEANATMSVLPAAGVPAGDRSNLAFERVRAAFVCAMVRSVDGHTAPPAVEP